MASDARIETDGGVDGARPCADADLETMQHLELTAAAQADVNEEEARTPDHNLLEVRVVCALRQASDVGRKAGHLWNRRGHVMVKRQASQQQLDTPLCRQHEAVVFRRPIHKETEVSTRRPLHAPLRNDVPPLLCIRDHRQRTLRLSLLFAERCFRLNQASANARCVRAHTVDLRGDKYLEQRRALQGVVELHREVVCHAKLNRELHHSRFRRRREDRALLAAEPRGRCRPAQDQTLLERRRGVASSAAAQHRSRRGAGLLERLEPGVLPRLLLAAFLGRQRLTSDPCRSRQHCRCGGRVEPCPRLLRLPESIRRCNGRASEPLACDQQLDPTLKFFAISVQHRELGLESGHGPAVADQLRQGHACGAEGERRLRTPNLDLQGAGSEVPHHFAMGGGRAEPNRRYGKLHHGRLPCVRVLSLHQEAGGRGRCGRKHEETGGQLDAERLRRGIRSAVAQ
mmetsp:Transcript_118690/g.378424  ORF Transcript_118690/g.378424 Transcript_118690/m.378424 type:complete len:457 (+) Transcript_118690:235-1605(+)